MMASVARWQAATASSERLKLECEPGDGYVDDVVRLVEVLARARYSSRLAERIVLASYELLQNAVSYGSVRGPVVYRLVEAGDGIVVEVSNTTIAARERMLREQLRRAGDRGEASMVDELRSASSGTFRRPMLGLIRVCHEAGMAVEVESNDGHLTVRARCAR